jgi:hypothetical protein
MRCAKTGQELNDPSEGIWDDGEWISWDWINGQLYEQERQAEFPGASIEIIQIYDDLVDAAIQYKTLTGRYLQIWGELGELYAEIKFGIKRHPPGAQGSDGRLGNDFVEVKTISPEKGAKKVQVKRAGNFNKLLVVKINENFEFEAKMVDRHVLAKGTGKHASISWRTIPEPKIK